MTVWLLIVMGVTMVVGSIFPQGYGADTYIASWGQERYELFSKLGFLNLFHTKYFLILGVILLLNLVFCSILRWFQRSGVGLAASRPPDYARTIAMRGSTKAAEETARSVLTTRGFKILGSAGGVLRARRGPWPEGVSLLYHVAMAVAIIGFILSALFSFEGDVTLYPGEPVKVPTVSAETGLQQFLPGDPDTTAWQDRYVELTLNEFITHWELHKDKYYPRDWLSDVDVRLPGDAVGSGTDDEMRERTARPESGGAPVHGSDPVLNRLVEVNRPLRVAGLTFYQMAYEQEFDVVVWKDSAEVERVPAMAYAPFALESVGGTFFPGTLRVGTLYEKYRETRPVVPHTVLKWQPPAADDADTLAPPPERVELGDLSAEVPLDVEGYSLTLENPYEGSVLSYRHDPGVPLLYIAIIAFMVGLAIRTYWPSYRVSLWLEGTAGAVTGRLTFRATGMLGEPEEIEEKLAQELTG